MKNTVRKFKVGDKVQPKLGGPMMIIKNYGTDGEYLCVWQEKDTDCEGMYDEILLEAVDDSIRSILIHRGV